MMSLKEGVSLGCMKVQIVFALMVTGWVFEQEGAALVITSVCDGQHGERSLHPDGHAADIRTRHLKLEQKKRVAKTLKKQLGDEYDVVLEPTHLHLEYDP